MHSRRLQKGAYLLEALVGILIFSFGILGIVGLQAQAIRFTNDSEYRAEAVYLANSLISEMWTVNRATLPAYRSPSGAQYVNFNNNVSLAFGGAMSTPPEVLVDSGPPLPLAPSKTSSVVQVTIFWRLPGDPVALEHKYTTTGIIGQNN